MCLASPGSSAWHCQGPWPWSSAHKTQASVVDACSARAAGSSPRGHHVGARAKGPSVRSMSCWGRAEGSLCWSAAALLKQFLPPSPCRYHGAASEGWGAIWPPPMGSVGSGCSILEAVWQGGQTHGWWGQTGVQSQFHLCWVTSWPPQLLILIAAASWFL